jgi:DNA repair exonuclease SbcCD ATPase subunit
VIIGAIRDELLDPARITRMAKELERRFAERVKSATQKGIDAPRELAELDARLDRLRARLRSGDHADMEPDEIQAAIERVEAKRRELAAAQSSGSAAKIITLLPKAAEAYRRQVEAGLDGHPERAAKARGVLRELVGPVQIKTESDGSVWAEYETRPAALLNAAGVCTYTVGRGDRI